MFLASWNHTLVACKLLMDPADQGHDPEAAAERVLSQTSPLMADLQQVGSTMLWYLEYILCGTPFLVHSLCRASQHFYQPACRAPWAR